MNISNAKYKKMLKITRNFDFFTLFLICYRYFWGRGSICRPWWREICLPCKRYNTSC